MELNAEAVFAPSFGDKIPKSPLLLRGKVQTDSSTASDSRCAFFELKIREGEGKERRKTTQSGCFEQQSGSGRRAGRGGDALDIAAAGEETKELKEAKGTRADMHQFVLLFWLLVPLVRSGVSMKSRNVHFAYPVQLLGTPASDLRFQVESDALTCFENTEHSAPNYFDAFMCLFPWASHSCESIWGSRALVIEISGSAEVLKLSQPVKRVHSADSIVPLNATRWLLLSSPSNSSTVREIVQVAAEPLYLCARSNDWNGHSAELSFSFRHVYVRERDRAKCLERLFYHFLLLYTLSSRWFLPYVVALSVGVWSFQYGLQKIILLGSCSSLVLCLAPLMLTKKHRHHAKLYLHYFFTRSQAEEAQQLIRKRMPLFQAAFFSSALLCIGCMGSYMVFHYFGISRDARNTLLNGTISMSLTWLAFFICRSFERFFSEWIWVAVSVGLAKSLEEDVNPLSRDKIAIALFVFSLCAVQAIRWVAEREEVQELIRGMDKHLPLLRMLSSMRIRGKSRSS